MNKMQNQMLDRCFKKYFSFSYRLAEKLRIQYEEPSNSKFIEECGKIYYSLVELARLESEWDNLVQNHSEHNEKSSWICQKIMPVLLTTQRLLFKNLPHNPYERYVIDNGMVKTNPKFIEFYNEITEHLKLGIQKFLSEVNKE